MPPSLTDRPGPAPRCRRESLPTPRAAVVCWVWVAGRTNGCRRPDGCRDRWVRFDRREV